MEEMEIPEPSQPEPQVPEPQNPESPQEQEQPSAEDLTGSYHDDSLYRSTLISVLVQGFNGMILEMREHNELLTKQNALLKEELKE